MNETMLLREKEVFPDEETLKKALGNVYPVFRQLMETIKAEAAGLICEWRYYNDGKAWLMKAVWKKKTIFWLSVWDGYFKIGFYFTEKTISGLYGLPVSQSIKDRLMNARPTGRLIAVSIDVDSEGQSDDIVQLVGYKKRLK